MIICIIASTTFIRCDSTNDNNNSSVLGLLLLSQQPVVNVCSALGSGLNNWAYSLAVDSNGNVYAGGAFTTAGGTAAQHIAKWNGASWSALGTGIPLGDVNALAADLSGNLYAGGGFLEAGGTSVNRIAKWNGTSWSALGTGMNDHVS